MVKSYFKGLNVGPYLVRGLLPWLEFRKCQRGLMGERGNFVVRVRSFLCSMSCCTFLELFVCILQDQLCRVTLLSLILFLASGLSADGALPSLSSRTPSPSLVGLPNIPSSFRGYNYIIFKLGPLQMTRKGLSVASTSACLTFTVSFFSIICFPAWFGPDD